MPGVCLHVARSRAGSSTWRKLCLTPAVLPLPWEASAGCSREQSTEISWGRNDREKSSGLGQIKEEPSRSVRIEAFDEFLQWLCFTRGREKEREGKKEKGKAVNLTE